MRPRHRVALILMTLAACVGCDQQTKTFAEHHLRGKETTSLLADTIRLDYTENPGAFLSLGESLPPRWRTALFTFGTGTALAALLLYAFLGSKSGFAKVLGLSLICGGGLGNLTDRLVYAGHVRDFLNVGLGPLRTGIFNLADVALLTGCLLLLLQEVRRSQANAHR